LSHHHAECRDVCHEAGGNGMVNSHVCGYETRQMGLVGLPGVECDLKTALCQCDNPMNPGTKKPCIELCGTSPGQPASPQFECDDGDVLGGDCCSDVCLLDPAPHLSDEPRPAGPAPARSCDYDGTVCTTGTCDTACTWAGLSTPPEDDDNQTWACTGSEQCTEVDAAAGTPCEEDGTLCTAEACDGAGTCVESVCHVNNPCKCGGTCVLNGSACVCQF
jgi:hypothetical protein